MIPSRGKHRASSLKFPRSNLSPFLRDSRRETFAYRPIPLFSSSSSFSLRSSSHLSISSESLSLLPSGSPIRLLLVPRIFSVFSASSAVECHNFRESLRFGRRWVETADGESASNEPIAENLSRTPTKSASRERAAAPPPFLSPIRPSSCVQHRAMPLSLSFFFPLPQPRASPVSLLHARPSSFTGFSQFYYRALPSRLTM